MPAILLVGDPPSCILVKRVHCACECGSVCAEILFIENIIVRDDEGHHARGPILGWICDQSELAIPLAAGSRCPQYAEIVTMHFYGIAAFGSASGLRDQARGRDIRRICSVRLCAIAPFGGDEFVASRNRDEFVVTYS